MDYKKLSSLKVLCIGDIMLDHYVYGTVKRQSPEAPIPILSYENENFQLGGVGNVARNISDIGANCSLLSILSSDNNSKKIKQLISNEKKIKLIGTNIKNFTAPIKTRYLNEFNHVLRVDDEIIDFKLKNLIKKKISNIIKVNIKKCDIIILSDYNKGFLDRSIIERRL